MGQSYNKQEEIVIAQNGANNANQSSLEQKLEIYGIAMASLVVIILMVAMVFACKRCHKGARKWARKELISAVALSQGNKTAQQPESVPYV